MSLLVGLDIGTSGGRALVVDEQGNRVAAASRPWRYRQIGPGIAELDPQEAWTALADATREAVNAADASQVAALGVTSQRTGVVCVDENGVELYAGPNADGRAVSEGIAMESDHRDLVYRTAGRLPVMLYLPARLAWLRANLPDVAERIRWALSFGDWAVFRLTGQAGTDPTQAAEMLVYDLATDTWSEELCDRLGVPSALLPDIRDVGTPTGSLTADAADQLGLSPGLPIVAGGSDTQAAALAMGVTRSSQSVVVAGSTMLCQQPTEEVVIDDEQRLWTSPHLSGGYVLEAHCGESGVPLDWMADLLGESHEWMDKAAEGAEPGAGGMLFVDPAPSKVGDFPLMRTGGMSFQVPLLALGRSREAVARATFEGVAFAAAAGLDWLEGVGSDLEEVYATGGVVRARTFPRILATALHRPLTVARETNGSALGAAIVAAVGGGVHADVGQAVDAMADRGEIVDPEPSWTGPTATAYAGWRDRVQRMDENSMRVSHMIGAP